MADIDVSKYFADLDQSNEQDQKELAMRMAYVIVRRDAYIARPETDYRLEKIVDLNGKIKHRITIEFED